MEKEYSKNSFGWLKCPSCESLLGDINATKLKETQLPTTEGRNVKVLYCPSCCALLGVIE